MTTRSFALAIAVLLASAMTPAHAQFNNQPYQGSLRAGGFGMSFGHRQAILERELFGRQSNPLVRGPGGELLEIERRGSQAFVRTRDTSFLPARGFDPTSGGLGWGNQSAGASSVVLRAGLATPSLFWLGMLDEPARAAPWSGLTSGATVGAPVDTWIRQLHEIAAF